MWSALVLIALSQANLVCWKNSGVEKCVPEGNRPTHGGHTARAGGRSGAASPYAFFEFAPAGGAGMGTACSCVNPTGAKGEVATVSRTSSAYCTKGGFATTGLTTSSMVLCGSNIVRVETNPSGDLAVLTEVGATNIALQSEDFTAASWTSTAAVTADLATSPWGAAVADRILDGSAVAIQGSCQTITTASATQHTFSVYLTTATISAASVSMTGVGSSTGDCTASTTGLNANYTRLSCTSPAAYAGTLTAVTVCVNVGTVVGDTGAIYAVGAQHETGAVVASSYIPTTTVTVSRQGDAQLAFFGVTLTGMASTGSAAATVTPAASSLAGGPLLFMATTGRALYVNGSNQVAMFDGTNIPVLAATPVALTPKRYWSSWTGATLTLTNATDVTSTTSAFTGTMNTTGPLETAANVTLGTSNWLISKVCLDPATTRCR